MWITYHRYRHLVEQGKAKPLLCPDCDTELITQPDDNADPILWCHQCDHVIKPGLDVYHQIRAVVNEHYME